jgi:hypothetical protein
MHDTDTPGSGASTTEPQPPDELWGVWRPGVEVWLPQDPSRNYRDNPLSYTKREAAQERADDWNRRMKHDIQVPAIPALLGVSPAVVAQRDRLAGLLKKVMAYCAERWVVGQHRTLDMELLEEIETALDEVGGAAQMTEGERSTADER